MKRSCVTALAGLAALVTLVVAPSTAHAVERQHHIGGGPSFAMLKVDDKSTLSTGVGGALHYTYGINDQFNLMGELGVAIVAANQKQDLPDSPRTRPSEVDHLTAGVGYVIDVLQWVPYFGVLAGAYRLAGGTLESALVLPGAEATLGLDYQLSRQVAIGAAVQQHMFFTKLDTYPSYTTALLRIEYMWGW